MESDEKSIAIIDAVPVAEDSPDNLEDGFSFAHIISHPEKRAFLTAYSQLGDISAASEAVGISRECHYRWSRNDPVYADCFTEADVRFGDILEAEARKRALQKSDLLMIFTLKAQKPWKYNDKLDVTSGGKPLEPPKIEVVYEVKQGSNDT